VIGHGEGGRRRRWDGGLVVVVVVILELIVDDGKQRMIKYRQVLVVSIQQEDVTSAIDDTELAYQRGDSSSTICTCALSLCRSSASLK